MHPATEEVSLNPRYTHIVMSLSYRELLALNEQQLEKMGVTKVTLLPKNPLNWSTVCSREPVEKLQRQ